MHFGKTYSQLLLTLPPELQENAIEYRQLKKLINKVVNELVSLGLSPSVLQTLLQTSETTDLDPSASGSLKGKGKERAVGERPIHFVNSEASDGSDDTSRSSRRSRTKAIYEVVHDGEHIQPRLRIQVPTLEDTPDVGIADNTADFQCSESGSHFVSEAQFSKPADPESKYNLQDLGEENLELFAKPLITRPGQSLIWALQKRRDSEEAQESTAHFESADGSADINAVGDSIVETTEVEVVQRRIRTHSDGTREIIIPLQSDEAFFELLFSALQTLSSHLNTVRSNFVESLQSLAASISRTARPQSSRPGNFHPFSSCDDPQEISAPLISPFSTSFIPGGMAKSDLYAWREIFQLYTEAEVFESVQERDRGERDFAEAERRLALFAEQVTSRGLNDKRKLSFKESRDALEEFLHLNVLILNLKKFQFANAEAARKILKKHAKRTALPFPIPQQHASSATPQVDSQVSLVLSNKHSNALQTNILTLIPTSTTSLPHLLVQAIGETLLPIVPHLDDYSCLICFNIAFKPIRLNCGHLFCVRCLVKMQKRGQDHCPCCRAPTVLIADRSNVDWAMLNFMQDWFPRETAKKLKQNEKEAAQEQLEELGISDKGCIVA